MGNFGRILAITLRRRLLVAGSVGCSLAVAVLWVGNITPLLPIVDAVMLNKSIPQWLEEGRAERQVRLDDLDRQRRQTEEALAAAPAEARSELDHELTSLSHDRFVAVKRLQWYDAVLPWARRNLPATPFKTLLLVCGWLVVGTLLKSGFRIAGQYFSLKLGNVAALELRKEFYRRTLRLDLATFRQTTPGDLLNRFTTDVQAAAAATYHVYAFVIREPLRLVGCLLGAAWVSWQLLLLTLVSAPLAGYAIQRLAKSLKRANRRALQDLSLVFDQLEETFGAIPTVQAFACESRQRTSFYRTCKQLYRRSNRIALYDSLVSPVTEVAGIVIVVAAALCGGYLVLNRQTSLLGIPISEEPLTHGLMTLFFGMLAGASDPIRRLTGIFNALQQGSAASDHLYELFDREPRLPEPARPVGLPRPAGAIRFHRVSFGYRPGEPVLRDLSLDVAPGETIAIVGPNGCGKSTLAHLLARLYDPDQGAIELGGVDLRQVRLRDVRDRLGVVAQDAILFNDSVAANIRLGKFEATDEEVIAAARKAHAHEFIVDKLEEGYRTIVGPRGNRLSGGQRQRIALARTILRNPEVLILDEATSQIDVESEQLIHDALAQFVRGRTTLLITHRASTLALADRIVVMDQGRIVDAGAFDELAARSSWFRSLAFGERAAAA